MKKCERVISHVWSVAVTGPVNWAWTQENTKLMREWENKILRMTFRSKRKKGRRMGVPQEKDHAVDENVVEKDEAATVLRKGCKRAFWAT